MMSYRPTVYGTRHAVSAGHYLATMAGFSILEGGGNAIDAGCAAGMALGVLQPDLVNFAGVAPIMMRLADGKVETIAGLGHWPRGLDPQLFMREHGGRIPHGVLRTVIPAAPDAWITALERHGTMSFGEVSAAAIRFAAEGFAVYPLLAQSIRAHEAEYARWPQNAAIFLPGGAPPAIGDKFVQSDLAKTITYMADEEKVASGKGREAGLAAARDAFYRGDIAREIVAFHKHEGGLLSAEDLQDYRSRLEPTVRRYWRGHEVIVCGPWCQGPALLEALLLAERAGIAGLEHNSAGYLHVVAECLKLAFADRERFFGDPRFIDVPIDYLLAPEIIVRRAAAFDPRRAWPEMPRRRWTASRGGIRRPKLSCHGWRRIRPMSAPSIAGAMRSAPPLRMDRRRRRLFRASGSFRPRAAVRAGPIRGTPAGLRRASARASPLTRRYS